MPIWITKLPIAIKAIIPRIASAVLDPIASAIQNKTQKTNNIGTIEKEEKYVVKNLRLDADLVERGSAISQKKGISFNKFVNLALEFALDRFEEE